MKQFKHQDVMTVRDVFKGTMFVIPSFQRPYEWKPDLCEKLFDDIYDAFDCRNREDEHYFVGSLVMYDGKKGNDGDDIQNDDDASLKRKTLENSVKGRDRGLLKVVDGQQRLTSLLLLLIALRDCELKSGGLGEEGDNLRYELDDLITACKGRRGDKNNDELVRIRTNVLEDQDFIDDLQKIFNAQGQFSESERRDLERCKSKRFKNYFRFLKLIEDKWGFPTAKGKKASKECGERREFTKFLLDNVQLLQLVCENRDDAFKLFEVVNSRGLELSQASIMKPRIVAAYHTKKERKALLELWNKMDEEKEKNYLLNLFLDLRSIRMAESGKPDQGKEKIVEYFRDEGFLKDSFKTLRKMYAIHCFTGDPKLTVLRSILDKFPLTLHRPAFYKFMLDLFEANSLFTPTPGRELEYEIDTGSVRVEDILKPAYGFCEQIIRFYLGNMLTERFSRDKVRDKFRELVVAVAQGDESKRAFLAEVPEGLKEELDKLKVRDCYDDISSNLSFVLVWFCTYLKYRDKPEEMKRYSQLFVQNDGTRIIPDREHIHPKDWSEHDGWTEEIHNEKTNLIGNLIPLEKEINRTAGKDGLRKKVTGEGSKTKSKLTYESSNSPEAQEIAARVKNNELPDGWLAEHVDAATEEKIDLLKKFFGCK